MTKVYISLPISNHEDDVIERSEKYKEELRDLGYEPVSPLDINNICDSNLKSHKEKRAEYLGNDIKELLQCSMILMCPGWEQSPGCKSEKYMAVQFNIPVIYYSEAEYKKIPVEVKENNYILNERMHN